ncbi:MAG: hypothetical protein CVU84_06265 [Firmicutes bacterium HGW-Firmicutes-1]|jgi:hypothetical protein|nr:MAG: hypothetical protein CVU84_06265 [Firmicutes bacterium HGW-Firmicutes-1]
MRLSQKGEDGTINYQAKNLTINNGISYTEVRQIALDIFKYNFLEMQHEAKSIAQERAEEITETFLKRMVDEYPEGMQLANTPDFQYSLYLVQKQYARYGDEELGHLLVDLLVNRTKYDNRSIIQIVLNESLEVVSRLTIEQISVLSIIFVFKYCKASVNSLDDLYHLFDKYFKPLAGSLAKSLICYQHLEYAGCGQDKGSGEFFGTLLSEKYGGLFSKGIELEEFSLEEISPMMIDKYFDASTRDEDKFQLSAISWRNFERDNNDSLIKEDSDKIFRLYMDSKLTDIEIEEEVIQKCEFMKKVIDIWNNSTMRKFELTSVGIAIGHANMKKTIGSFEDLSTWIS